MIHSLRTRITITMLCVLLIAITVVTLLSAVFIRKTESARSDQLLLLLCETGERNLNYYFNSVQKSVEKVADFTEADITGLGEAELKEHVNRVREYFDVMASKTNGVLTYYYRIDPEVSPNVKGFWYTDLNGNGFVEHEVTDISLYDMEDTSKLVWFTVPKYEGKAIWLPPYITENLDKRVISYDVPIFYEGRFVGVVGIEIDYSTMAEQVDSIRLYKNGYAFLSDSEGNLFYHPRIDVTQFSRETPPAVPEGAVADNTFLRYTFEGTEKEAAWLPLSNGMRLVVTVPVVETEGDWKALVFNILIAAAVVLVVTSLFSMLYTRRITGPLEQLIEAAEKVDQGDYDYVLDYDRDDEVGRLTKTFKQLTAHVRDHISNLSEQVFIDAMTRMKNKGAFTKSIDNLQNRIKEDPYKLSFAIGMFDCDELKFVNDHYGHDRGDVYLKTASRLIGSIFKRSPVFRIGGDEFAVILKDEDYKSREELLLQLEDVMNRINATNLNQWEQVHLAYGIADYDPNIDRKAEDVVRRADRAMYENKRERKIGR